MSRLLISLWFFLLCTGCETVIDPIVESQKMSLIKNAHTGYRLGLTIREATVTYVVKAGPDPVNDPAGFFLQAHSQGPGLFFPFATRAVQSVVWTSWVLDMGEGWWGGRGK